MDVQNLLGQKCILSAMTLGGMMKQQNFQQENYPLIVAMVARVANPVISNSCDWDFYRAYELLEHLKKNRTVTVSSLSTSHFNFVMMNRSLLAKEGEAELIVRQTVKVNSYDQLENEVQDIALISKAFNSIDPEERLEAQLELLKRPVLPRDVSAQLLIREVTSYFQRMCLFDLKSEVVPVINRWRDDLKKIFDIHRYLEISLLLALAGHIERPMLSLALQQIQDSQESNHPDICFLFGKLLWEGKNGIKKNEFLGLGCLELLPNNFETLCQLGTIYLCGGQSTQKNPEKAIDYFKKAVSSAPENPDYLYKLAIRLNQTLNHHTIFHSLQRAFLVKAHNLDPKNEKIVAALTENYLGENIEFASVKPKG